MKCSNLAYMEKLENKVVTPGLWATNGTRNMNKIHRNTLVNSAREEYVSILALFCF